MAEHTICVAILKGKVPKQCSARAKPGFVFCGRHLVCFTEKKTSSSKAELDKPQYSTFDMDQLYKALVDARREDAFGEKSLRIQEMIVQRASAC